MLADYFIVRPWPGQEDTEEYGAGSVNRAGICSIPLAFILAQYLLYSLITIEIFTALGVVFVVYPVLRQYIFKPRYQFPSIDNNIQPESG